MSCSLSMIPYPIGKTLAKFSKRIERTLIILGKANEIIPEYHHCHRRCLLYYLSSPTAHVFLWEVGFFHSTVPYCIFSRYKSIFLRQLL